VPPDPSASRAEAPIPGLTLYLQCFAPADGGDWSSTFAQAEAADAAGVDRLLVSDHVVFGERLDEYGRPEVGGVAGGKQPTGPDGHWLEPLTVLAMVAARTTRVRLRTQILLAGLRRPVTLAKTAATLDVLSGGRLELGVGVGWQREEYEAAGLDFERRGRLLDHSLEVCQALWTQSPTTYSSAELSFNLGERNCAQGDCSPPGPLRGRVDPVGSRRRQPSRGHPAHARGCRRRWRGW
jgi:alkanesulfonate monooxygenase SsuD/methylene tetrahydromethanopterin reductase-like flavin-dependent oxidoreductase (luciferase family)